MIKYLGSKRRLVPVLREICRTSGARTALDLFTGTTRVAQAFKAEGVHVTAVDSARYAHVVVLEVIRHLPPGPPGEVIAGWPFLDRGETDSVDPEEPASYSGLGHHGPFG